MLPPHEIKAKDFTHAIRGYSAEEVDEYADFVLKKYTELYRENDALETKIAQMKSELDKYHSDEESIRNALVEAQRSSTKLVDEANERAEIILHSAKLNCDKILSEFKSAVKEERDELLLLRGMVKKFKEDLFIAYQTHIEYIEKIAPELDSLGEEEFSDEAIIHLAVESIKSDIINNHSNSGSEEAEEFISAESTYNSDRTRSLDGENSEKNSSGTGDSVKSGRVDNAGNLSDADNAVNLDGVDNTAGLSGMDKAVNSDRADNAGDLPVTDNSGNLSGVQNAHAYNISGAAAVSDAHKEADLDLKEYSAQTDEESSLNNLSDRNDSTANGDKNKDPYVFSGDTETSEELAGNKKSAYELGYHKPGFAAEIEYDENDLVAEIMNTGSESLSDVVKKLENDIAFKDLEGSVDSQAEVSDTAEDDYSALRRLEAFESYNESDSVLGASRERVSNDRGRKNYDDKSDEFLRMSDDPGVGVKTEESADDSDELSFLRKEEENDDKDYLDFLRDITKG